jgi:hypothetical protein
MNGGGIYVTRNSHPVISRTIVAFNPAGGGVVREDTESTLTLSCNDVYGNTSVDYSGVTDPTGTNGNQSEDPLFCGLTGCDLHLSLYSPCAAANSPTGCSLVGALDQSCAPTPTKRATWGQIKVQYR